MQDKTFIDQLLDATGRTEDTPYFRAEVLHDVEIAKRVRLAWASLAFEKDENLQYDQQIILAFCKVMLSTTPLTQPPAESEAGE
jgi:hypothetical protein